MGHELARAEVVGNVGNEGKFYEVVPRGDGVISAKTWRVGLLDVALPPEERGPDLAASPHHHPPIPLCTLPSTCHLLPLPRVTPGEPDLCCYSLHVARCR